MLGDHSCASMGTEVKGAKWEVCVCVFVLAGICGVCVRGRVCMDVCAHACVPSVRQKESGRLSECLSV